VAGAHDLGTPSAFVTDSRSAVLAGESSRPTYEPNPKHKQPWQRGRRGALCPQEITLAQAQALLDGSVTDAQNPRTRYATDGRHAYCGRPHRESAGLWHGYPVPFVDVPATILKAWQGRGEVSHSIVRRHWMTP
jgi:hypothetical protein